MGNAEVSKKIIKWLTVAGIVCSCAAWLTLALAMPADKSDVEFNAPRSKPIIYYAMHGAGMFAVIGAGILAGIKGGYRKLSKTAQLAFWVLQAAAIAWACIAYDISDFMTWKALGATGPMVWLTCVFLFAGMDQSLWKTIDSTVYLIAYITAGLAVYEMVSVGFTVADRWFSSHVRYMVLSMWLGGWTLLSIWNCSGWRILLRSIPFVVFVLSCILTRTRSWMLMSILLLISLFFVINRSEINLKRIRAIKILIPYILIMCFLLIGLFAREPVINAWEGLVNRLGEDSRSGQYVEFFDQVPLTDLILGRGPNGTYVFGWKKNYQFFDNAYIWMAFIGGLPILISYFVLIILPGIKAYFQGAKNEDAAAAVLLTLWGLACSGLSTYALPSVVPYCFFLYLLAGRCHAFLSERHHG